MRERGKPILRRVRELTLNNFWLKLIALLMAFVLWFIVTGGPKREELITARLSIDRYIPAGWALASAYDDQIELRLRGRSDEIGRLLDPATAGALITINIDPSLIEAGRSVQRIELDAGNVSLPFGVEVLDVSPGSIPLQLDRVETKSIPVAVNLSGQPAAGYRLLGGPTVAPAEIEVSGAKQLVDQLSIITIDLSLNGLSTREQRVVLPLSRDPLLRYSQRSVEVSLDIVEENETTLITVDPSNFVYGSGDQPVTIDIDPREIVLQISGPRSWVQTLESAQVRVIINPEEVQVDGGRTLIEFKQEMISFANPHARPELVTVRSNPGEFHVVVSS